MAVITANKEVILSAGSVQSPQLLELSGIGNASILAAAGVEQMVYLPSVGENLQDHVRITTAYQLHPNYTSPNILRFNTTYAAQQLQAWTLGETSWYDEISVGTRVPQFEVLFDDGYLGMKRYPAVGSSLYGKLFFSFIASIQHAAPTSTAEILPKEDGGVVDPELKVYGLSNLRIVDASVISLNPSGHIQTPVCGIAERAAQMITAQWS
ncbi:Uu.00g122640.m01.CDS01 [Anthostomella pinea]|uniref:Uu.00g122640.m01.CDS01 n=1 Tax=Anthostomella pinea TaxID=933095 RepID=A0AAI8VI73_9PEZI|nr:Uu.00g122640.m01.CDS01 [Anthostomella pinea]